MTRGWLSVVVLAASVCWATGARADEARTAYIARALASLHQLGAGRAQLEAELYQATRTACPQLGACVDAIVDERCQHERACEAAADVIVTNLRAANQWVDEATRARLVRSATDYHSALAIVLRKRYAALAAELVSTPGEDARAIDQLCTTRDRVVHACTPGDDACVPSIPWTRCVAALVWFVGDSP